MSRRSPEPCRHGGTAPYPRRTNPGARRQTLCDTDRNGAGTRDRLTQDHRIATAQFFNWFDEPTAGAEAPALRRPEPRSTAPLEEEVVLLSKDAALGDRRFEARLLRQGSLSHRCLPCGCGRKCPAFAGASASTRPENGTCGHEPAHLGCLSLTGIDAPPLREFKAPRGLGPGTLCRALLFSSPGGCADRPSGAADRVR